MDIHKWINKNRKEIDAYTKSPYKNDTERYMWIINDEFLYNACRNRVKL
ncbi:MAG: hypothetical protein ACQESN_11725 [Thermotogota bacterium]